MHLSKIAWRSSNNDENLVISLAIFVYYTTLPISGVPCFYIMLFATICVMIFLHGCRYMISNDLVQCSISFNWTEQFSNTRNSVPPAWITNIIMNYYWPHDTTIEIHLWKRPPIECWLFEHGNCFIYYHDMVICMAIDFHPKIPWHFVVFKY